MNVISRSPLFRVGIAAALAVALTATVTAAAPANTSVLPDDGPAVTIASSVGAPNDGAAGEDSEAARAVPIVAIVVAAIAAGGTAHAMGTEAAKTAYHAGYRNAAYQDDKWLIRATAVGLVGPVLGVTFMVGFQNQFYSMI